MQPLERVSAATHPDDVGIICMDVEGRAGGQAAAWDVLSGGLAAAGFAVVGRRPRRQPKSSASGPRASMCSYLSRVPPGGTFLGTPSSFAAGLPATARTSPCRRQTRCPTFGAGAFGGGDEKAPCWVESLWRFVSCFRRGPRRVCHQDPLPGLVLEACRGRALATVWTMGRRLWPGSRARDRS